MEKLKELTLPLELIAVIGEIERFQGQWTKLGRLEPAKVESLKRTTVITSSGASTRIEGAVLGDREVGDLIAKGCRIDRMSSRSEREVAGYVRALEYIYAHGTDLPVAERTIRELHQMLASELTRAQLPEGQRGAYKNVFNHVIERDEATGAERTLFATTPPGPQTEAAMQQLVANYSELETTPEVPALIAIAGFVVHFLAVHPFRDGNGRMSRLMTTWLMLRSGYSWVQFSSHEKIIEDNKEAYYVGLNSTQRSFQPGPPDYLPWMRFFLMIVRRQCRFLEQTLLLGDGPGPAKILILSTQEKQVLALVRERGPSGLSELLGHVSLKREGLRDLLGRLVKKGALIRHGKGPATKYAAAEV